jgi:copper transport protein
MRGQRGWRWQARAAATTLAAAALVLGAAAPASAHAYLVRSDPADGSVLAAAPAAITLSFSESVQPRDTVVEVLAGGGQRIVVTAVHLRRPAGSTGTAEVDTEQPVELVVGLPELRPDTYRVSWRTLSSDDLHATSGVLVFGVQREVTAAGTATDPPPRPVEAALRWLGFLGTAGLLGGLLLALLANRPVRSGPSAELRRRLAGSAATGGVAAAALAPLLVVAQAGLGGTGRVLLTTGYGPRWLGRELSLLVLVAVALRLRADRARRPTAVVAGLAVGGLGVTSALLGHAAAVSGSRPVWLVADAVHLTAALGWAGGVLVAAVVAGPLLRRPDQRPAVLAMLRAFGVVAAGGLALLVITGLLLAGGAVASLDALLLTTYGRTLVAKVILVGLAALLGLRTALLLRAEQHGPGRWPRGPGSPGLGGAVRREAAALAVVLGAAAVLAAAAPALGPRFAAPTGAPPGAPPGATAGGATAGSLASADAGDLVETLSVRPNRPGRNVVGIGVFDSRRPAPGPVLGVSVVLRSPDGAATGARSARRAADGDWTVTVDDLRTPGRWRVTVTALRAGLPATVASYDWLVTDPAARPPIVSAAPLAPPLNLAAALLGVAALLVGAGLARRARRRPAPAPPPVGPTPGPDAGPGPGPGPGPEPDPEAGPGGGPQAGVIAELLLR